MKTAYNDFVIVNIIHLLVSLIVIAVFPLFTVTVSDPIVEAATGASYSYQVECSTFYARAIGFDGKTDCTDYTFLYACWNTIEAVNTGTCSVTPTAHVSVGAEFYDYSFFGMCHISTMY
jgi:hypothetical protein